MTQVTSPVTSQNVLLGPDSDMSGANAWANDVGSPALSVSGGFLNFQVNAGVNTDVAIAGVMIVGKTYEARFPVRLVSGTPCPLRAGEFSSGPLTGAFEFTPSSTLTTVSGRFVATTTYFAIGAIYSQALAGVIAVGRVELNYIGTEDLGQNARLTALEGVSPLVLPDSFALGQVLASLSRRDKELVKWFAGGNSLTGRPLGGAIPSLLDEGPYCRPPRFGTNTWSRQLYDRYLSWNRAIFRQAAHSDWTKGGTWVDVNDGTVYEPETPGDSYYYSTDPGAWLERTVIAGQMGVIVHRFQGFGALDVTLNGGSIGAYGPTSIDLDRATPAWATADLGNPFHTETWGTVANPLPLGAKVRFTKRSDGKKVGLTTDFQWNGTTVVPFNIGHSGHNLNMLMDQGHMQAELAENSPDALTFELPVMNEVDKQTYAQSITALGKFVGTYVKGLDALFFTPHPFGKDALVPPTNYYTLYSNPSMAQVVDGFKRVLAQGGYPYQDVFNLFRRKIEARGGTLAGGEVAQWYLLADAQHTAPNGVDEVVNCLAPAFTGKLLS